MDVFSWTICLLFIRYSLLYTGRPGFLLPHPVAAERYVFSLCKPKVTFISHAKQDFSALSELFLFKCLKSLSLSLLPYDPTSPSLLPETFITEQVIFRCLVINMFYAHAASTHWHKPLPEAKRSSTGWLMELSTKLTEIIREAYWNRSRSMLKSLAKHEEIFREAY